MKPNQIMILLLLLTHGYTNAQDTQNLNAQKIWQNVINYYDPEGIWDEYRGEMHMYVLGDQEKPGEEDLIIDNAQNLYQCVMSKNDVIQIVGLKDGEAFFQVGDQKYTDESQLPDNADYRLKEEWARKFYEHHKMHFSVPLVLHERGAIPKESVYLDSFEGEDVYVLEFEKFPDAYEKGFFDGPVTLYVDADDYALKKAHFEVEFQGGPTAINRKEMNLNGIIVPRTRMFFNGEGEYVHQDAFYPFTAYDYQDDGSISVKK